MDRGLARVQQQEIAGPIGAFRLTRRQAALADERRLLIAERRGDGHAPERILRMTIYFRRRPDFRKHGARHMKGVEQFLEIGRASCRERVCQYVSLSVVAVTFKKKKEKKKK